MEKNISANHMGSNVLMNRKKDQNMNDNMEVYVDRPYLYHFQSYEKTEVPASKQNIFMH